MKIKPIWLKATIILEGLLCFVWVVSIPSDPKNAFFLGFSKFRWIQILILFAGTIILSIFNKYLTKLGKPSSSKNLIKYLSIFSIILLFFLLSTPPYRFKPFAAEYERIRPLITFGLLLLSNFYFFIKADTCHMGLKNLKHQDKQSKIVIFLSVSLVFLFFCLYFLLNQFFPTQFSDELLFSPPAPITAFQFFSIVLFVWFITQIKLDNFNIKNWIVLIAGAIFVFASLLWNFLPMPCTDDLIGPYPPNYVCYPPSNDAIYSIASHYGRLGAGIYNHWFTDKPVYIFFLMVTQWVSSPNIDHYIIVQTIFLATIPTLLFLFTKKVHNIYSGILIASLFIIREANNIFGYKMFGATNSRLESTEVFISLFLIIYGIVLFYWFRNKNNMFLAVFAGTVLGLTSLIRLNPVFIFPVTLFSLFYLFRKNLKRGLLISLLFSIGFIVGFSPWYVFSSDTSGQNYLFLKLNDIIQSRYKPTGNLDNTDFTDYKNASLIPINELDSEEIGSPVRIGLHFLNNNLQSFIMLPWEFQFHTLKFKSELPIWNDYSGFLSWHYPLSVQNIILLIFYILTIMFGIKILFVKYGYASFAPLIIQIGYTIGNGTAMTSGSRYLIPIVWVVFLYFSIGLVSFIGKIQNFLGIKTAIVDFEKRTISVSNSDNNLRKQKYLILIVIFSTFFFSFGLTRLDLITNKLDKPFIHPKTNKYLYLDQNDQININLLEEMTAIEGINLFHGYSFQPKYYRNNFFNTSPESFELVTLTQNKVIVSYINDFQEKYFSDESETLIIGCPIREENLWGADFLFVNAFMIVQLDNEEAIYTSKFSDWNCNSNK